MARLNKEKHNTEAENKEIAKKDKLTEDAAGNVTKIYVAPTMENSLAANSNQTQ